MSNGNGIKEKLMREVFRHLAHTRMVIPDILAHEIRDDNGFFDITEQDIITSLHLLLKKGYLQSISSKDASDKPCFHDCECLRVWNQPDIMYRCTKKGRELLI